MASPSPVDEPVTRATRLRNENRTNPDGFDKSIEPVTISIPTDDQNGSLLELQIKTEEDEPPAHQHANPSPEPRNITLR